MKNDANKSDTKNTKKKAQQPAESAFSKKVQEGSRIDWLIRLLKGMFIGAGFIMPGLSGGALATVFGLYERAIMFLANITKNFKENVFFFLPVGIGGIVGLFVFSVFLSHFFEVAEVQLKWFFIGCIAGTLPSLWRQAGKEGRKPGHVLTLAISLAVAVFFLRFIETAVGGAVPLNIYTWTMAGALIALGMIAPGLSSSNLLLFLQMYAPMTNGIANFDLSVIIPMGIGGLVTILIFSRIIAIVFERAYGLLFHSIIGLVLASTLLIVPINYDYMSLGGLLCVVAVVLGVLLGQWMCRLEEKTRSA